MKNTYRILIMLLFVVGMSLKSEAQDKNNPWAVLFGVNAIDFYPADVDSGKSGNLFNDYFNASEHWNIFLPLSTIEVKKFIGKGFVLKASGSINQIEKIGDTNVDKLGFFNLSAGLDYNFKTVLNSSVFDPFVGIGYGYFWMDDKSDSTFDIDLGLSLWLTDRLALVMKSSMKSTFNNDNPNYFQHTVGLNLSFNNEKN